MDNVPGFSGRQTGHGSYVNSTLFTSRSFPSGGRLFCPCCAPKTIRNSRKSRSGRRRSQPAVRALNSWDEDFGGPVDIDKLAAQLSREAERLRKLQSNGPMTSFDGSIESGDLADRAGDIAENIFKGAQRRLPFKEIAAGPFGYESKEQQKRVFAEVGDGGFSASDFEIIQQMGRLSVQRVSGVERESPMAAGRIELPEETAVIAFRGRYFSGMPFEDPAITFLKEFLPGAAAVGCNELQIAHRLTPMPERKWKFAVAPLTSDPPIVPLLGYFVAGSSEEASSIANTSNSNPSWGGSSDDALWLVYKWEGLQPLSQYAGATQTPPPQPLFWMKFSEEDLLAARLRMLRAIARGCLRAVAFTHERGVAHGSLGTGSFLLSTLDDHSADSLIVKLDNFGFARMLLPGPAASPEGSALYPSPRMLGEDHPIVLGQRDDLQAVAAALLETVFSGLAEGGPSEAASAGSLMRLLQDVFGGNVRDFRRYCMQESDWVKAVLFLDEFDRAGWRMIEDLLKGTTSAKQLLIENPFCSFQS